MLHPINTHHNNCRYSWIHFHSYPYSQDKFRGLSLSIHHRHSLSLFMPKINCSLPFIFRWYTKCSKIDCHTPQPLHPHTKAHQDKNLSYSSAAYLAIGTNSKITSYCTPPLHELWGWSQTLHQFWGWQYQHKNHLQNQLTSKHHIYCSQAQNNHVPPTAIIFIPNGITQGPRLWHNSSYRIIIAILHNSIIQSLVQKKPMIICALNILSSGKLASQMRSTDRHKVLVPACKLETITSSLYQKLKYQVE